MVDAFDSVLRFSSQSWGGGKVREWGHRTSSKLWALWMTNSSKSKQPKLGAFLTFHRFPHEPWKIRTSTGPRCAVGLRRLSEPLFLWVHLKKTFVLASVPRLLSHHVMGVRIKTDCQRRNELDVWTETHKYSQNPLRTAERCYALRYGSGQCADLERGRAFAEERQLLPLSEGYQWVY